MVRQNMATREGARFLRGMSRTWRQVLRGSVAVGLLAFTMLALSGCGPNASDGAPTALAASPPPKVAAEFNQAQTLEYAGHCDRAIPIFLHVLTEFDGYVNAYVGLAGCYSALGSFGDAITQYDKVVAVDPTNYGLYIGRAGVEASSGSTGAATADDLTALRLAPPQVPTYTTISDSFYSYQNYAGAVEAMDKAIALVPGDPALYEKRGGIYLNGMQDYTRALQDYRQAIAVAPFVASRATVYAAEAMVYQQETDYESAYNAIKTAISFDPQNAHYYVEAGDIYRGGSHFSTAVSQYDAALRLVSTGPDAELAHEGKGDALVGLGRPKDALTEYRAALRLTADPGLEGRIKSKIKTTQTGAA